MCLASEFGCQVQLIRKTKSRLLTDTSKAGRTYRLGNGWPKGLRLKFILKTISAQWHLPKCGLGRRAGWRILYALGFEPELALASWFAGTFCTGKTIWRVKLAIGCAQWRQ